VRCVAAMHATRNVQSYEYALNVMTPLVYASINHDADRKAG
jgi:hypothetical protein